MPKKDWTEPIPLIEWNSCTSSINTEWGLITYEEFVKKEYARRSSRIRNHKFYIKYRENKKEICLMGGEDESK